MGLLLFICIGSSSLLKKGTSPRLVVLKKFNITCHIVALNGHSSSTTHANVGYVCSAPITCKEVHLSNNLALHEQ